MSLSASQKTPPRNTASVCNLVMRERYQRADAAVLDKQIAEMDAMFRPHATEPASRVHDIYTRKHTSDFMREMCRSMQLWLNNWQGK